MNHLWIQTWPQFSDPSSHAAFLPFQEEEGKSCLVCGWPTEVEGGEGSWIKSPEYAPY